MTREEALPCPCCGEDDPTLYTNDGTLKVHAVCEACGCEAPLTAWNIRSPARPIPRVDQEGVRDMRAIVCGGRRYCDSADRRALVRSRLDAIMPDSIIVGDDGKDFSHGVDTAAYWWAIEAGVDVACCRALWKKRGNSAGPRRNGFMLTLNADTLIHFPGGTGTADMIRQAKDAGMRIVNGLDME